MTTLYRALVTIKNLFLFTLRLIQATLKNQSLMLTVHLRPVNVVNIEFTENVTIFNMGRALSIICLV